MQIKGSGLDITSKDIVDSNHHDLLETKHRFHVTKTFLRSALCFPCKTSTKSMMFPRTARLDSCGDPGADSVLQAHAVVLWARGPVTRALIALHLLQGINVQDETLLNLNGKVKRGFKFQFKCTEWLQGHTNQSLLVRCM